MHTDDLIRELAADGRPVRRLAPWLHRVVIWVGLSALCAATVIVTSGARRDLGQMWWSPAFMLEAVLLLVTALSAAAGALIVSVPGAERSKLVRWLPVMAGAAALLWIAAEVVFTAGVQGGRPVVAWWCIQRTLLVGLLPGIVLFAMIGRAAPLKAAWAGLLAVLATSAVGVFGTNIMCSVDRPTHLLLWHVGPMALLAAAGAGIGASLFDWTRRVRKQE